MKLRRLYYIVYDQVGLSYIEPWKVIDWTPEEWDKADEEWVDIQEHNKLDLPFGEYAEMVDENDLVVMRDKINEALTEGKE